MPLRICVPECACTCATLPMKIGTVMIIYIYTIYKYHIYIGDTSRLLHEINGGRIERISKSLWCFLPHKFIKELDFLPLKFW